ncbi:MAG: CRTAC1 family protein [Acidobacteria bacterium]|nr:CRTAC1 family protein [Acidobacteriota bacterium]MCI0719861.1 CRTAC1 family protein [Acidobacteriota bacterium]
MSILHCLLSSLFVMSVAKEEPNSSATASRPLFTDATSTAGIEFQHENGLSEEKLIVESVGSGVAWLDYDNDGWLDLYFVNGAELASGKRSPGNVLLRNTGQGKFVDVTRQAGVQGAGDYGMGVAVGDYDNDGWLDLYVTNYGPNLLFRNNRDGTFKDVTSAAGVRGGRWGSSAGFFDYDLDGDLDLYVVNYLDYNLKENPYCGLRKPGYRLYCDIRIFDGAPDQLYRNNGNGTFTDVSSAAGIANPAGKGLGLSFGDFDQDRHVDIYVANDTVRNFLYRNRGDGTFEDVTYRSGAGFDRNGKPQAGMGVDCADVNGDGLLDLFVTNFSYELNTLYRNQGDLLFEDVSESIGLGSSLLPLGFGTKLFDYDNDGDTDIFVANGHIEDNIRLYFPELSYEQSNLLYENVGGSFRDVSSISGPVFKARRVGRGAAAGDYDNDGDLDLVVSNSGQRATLIRNEGGNRNHWIAVVARGRKNNFYGLGAKVRVVTRGSTQLKEINNVASYCSSNDIRLYFGLGREDRASLIEITWPGGRKQILKDVVAGQIVRVEEP